MVALGALKSPGSGHEIILSVACPNSACAEEVSMSFFTLENKDNLAAVGHGCYLIGKLVKCGC